MRMTCSPEGNVTELTAAFESCGAPSGAFAEQAASAATPSAVAQREDHKDMRIEPPYDLVLGRYSSARRAAHPMTRAVFRSIWQKGTLMLRRYGLRCDIFIVRPNRLALQIGDQFGLCLRRHLGNDAAVLPPARLQRLGEWRDPRAGHHVCVDRLERIVGLVEVGDRFGEIRGILRIARRVERRRRYRLDHKARV